MSRFARAACLLSIAPLSAGAVGLAPAASADQPSPATLVDSVVDTVTETVEDTLTETVTETGTLVRLVSDDFARDRAGYAYGLRRGERVTTVEGLDLGQAKPLLGRRVHVTGEVEPAQAGTSTIDATTIQPAGPTAEAQAATTTKRVAVILVNFADSPTQPVTKEQLRATMFGTGKSVDAYYQDASDGQIGVTGDVVGWHTVSRASTTSCDYSAWGSAAARAATAAGTDLSAYDHVMYYWPIQRACSWAGLGELPGRTSWINGEPSLRVLAHELGHNFGEHHASAQQCTESGTPTAFRTITASCQSTEYGDPFTVMGSSPAYLHSNAARAHLRYLTPVTLTAGQPSNPTLSPLDSQAGVRVVRIPRGDGSYLTLEHRQPTGIFDAFALGTPITSGVTIRVDWGTGSQQTMLVDTVPGTATYSDAPLLPGRSVTDPVSGATIKVTGVTAAGAQLAIRYGGLADSADTLPPSAVANLRGSATTQPATLLQWGAATDESGVIGYRVWRDGTLLGETTATSYAESEVTRGRTYAYAVAAVDAWGNVGPRSQVSVSVPRESVDLRAPTAVSRLRATRIDKRTLRLTWRAASDDTRVVGYRVTRTAAKRKPYTRTTTGLAMSVRPGGGTWTWTVVAKDAAGNISRPARITVTIR